MTKRQEFSDDDIERGTPDPEVDELVWGVIAANLEASGQSTLISDLLRTIESLERADGTSITRPYIKWSLYRLYQSGLIAFDGFDDGAGWDNAQKIDNLKGKAGPGRDGYLTSVTVASPDVFVPQIASISEQYEMGPVPTKPDGSEPKIWGDTALEWIGRGAPFTVAYGAGVDSTAMLVQFVRLGLRPDLILFADVGAEKPETYAYLPIMDAYLKKHGFPPIVTVRYEMTEAGVTGRKVVDPKKKSIDPRAYTTLTENLTYNRTLPSLAYGFRSHACSSKWKVGPQESYISDGDFSPMARVAWKAGMPVVRAIGFDASKGDQGRRDRIPDNIRFLHWYPLQDWGWDRERCKKEIRKAGLPVPMKSACFFCPSTHPWEIERFVLLGDPFVAKLCEIENLARPYNKSGPHQGLWFVGDKLPGPIRDRHPYKAEYWFVSGKLTPEEMDYFIEVKWGGLPDYDKNSREGRKNLGRSGTKPGRMCDFIEVFKRFCKNNPKHPECSLEILEATFDAHPFRDNPSRPSKRFEDPYSYTSEGKPVSYHDNPIRLRSRQ